MLYSDLKTTALTDAIAGICGLLSLNLLRSEVKSFSNSRLWYGLAVHFHLNLAGVLGGEGSNCWPWRSSCAYFAPDVFWSHIVRPIKSKAPSPLRTQLTRSDGSLEGP